jgi:hypothetical protein
MFGIIGTLTNATPGTLIVLRVYVHFCLFVQFLIQLAAPTEAPVIVYPTSRNNAVVKESRPDTNSKVVDIWCVVGGVMIRVSGEEECLRILSKAPRR